MKGIPTAAVVLVVLAATLVAARLHTYDEPLQTDITGAAVIGHELLAGRALYADMWDHKPPALHLTHAVAIALVGYGPGAIFLLNITAGIVTLLGVYAAGAALGSVSAGLWAAAFWTAISGDIWMHGNQPNTEAFIALPPDARRPRARPLLALRASRRQAGSASRTVGRGEMTCPGG